MGISINSDLPQGGPVHSFCETLYLVNSLTPSQQEPFSGCAQWVSAAGDTDIPEYVDLVRGWEQGAVVFPFMDIFYT